MLAHQLQARGLEPAVVSRPSQRQAALISLQPLLSSRLDARHLAGIAAPRGKPNAQAGLVLGRDLDQRLEAVGETFMELPDEVLVVPLVVVGKGVHSCTAPLDQLLPDAVNQLPPNLFLSPAELGRLCRLLQPDHFPVSQADLFAVVVMAGRGDTDVPARVPGSAGSRAGAGLGERPPQPN